MSGARKVTQAGAVRVTEDVGIEPLPTLRDEFAFDGTDIKLMARKR